MPNIMLLATAWGPKHGGINAFNMDFAIALAEYLWNRGKVFCAVLGESREDRIEAQEHGVYLVPIDKPADSPHYDNTWAYEVVKTLRQEHPGERIDWWVGHDVISGAAAVEGPLLEKGSQAAVILHMSYRDYLGYKHGSGVSAVERDQKQREIFQKAAKHFAVGPLLRDAMHDMIDADITMLIPGFADIESRPAAHQLRLITFGRMDRESDRIKQGSLAVASFASACRTAQEVSGSPRLLRQNPQMQVIGIDQPQGEEERFLLRLANDKAGRALNVIAQPFTENRRELFGQLGQANLALMLSWHEGFGLTGWEAIAAQVPLIVSKQSGLYQLIDESLRAPGLALVKVIDVRGQSGAVDMPNYTAEDEAQVRDAILEMVRDLGQSQQYASELKQELEQKLVCTWFNTADQFCQSLGIAPDTSLEDDRDPDSDSDAPISTLAPPIQSSDPMPQHVATLPQDEAPALIAIRQTTWNGSQPDIPDRFMLLASSGVVPFHPYRDAFLQQRLDWAFSDDQPIKLCLVAGPGGVGKTRLLIEMCRRLKETHGWQAGFLQTVDHPVQELRALLERQQDCLIAIDYAETRASEVVELVRNALRFNPTCKVRFALSARAGGDWWNQLSELAGNDVALATVLASPRTRMGPYYLVQEAIALDVRKALFREALTAFAEKTGRSAVAVPTPDLAADYFNQILFIHLAAFTGLHGQTITDHRALLSAALQHEREYWKRALERDGVGEAHLDGFEQLIALLTLVGGTRSATETRALIKLAPRLQGAPIELENHMFDCLKPFEKPGGGAIGLQPDLLGERLIAESLSKDDGLLDVVFSHSARSSERIRSAYTVLARLARQDQNESKWLSIALEQYLSQTVDDAIAVAREIGEPMSELMSAAFDALDRPTHRRLLNIVRVRLPEDTTNLIDFKLNIVKIYTETIDHRGKITNFKGRNNAKQAYDLLAALCQSLGKFSEAVGAKERALEFAKEMWRSASVSNRVNCEITLAHEYNDLSVMYAKICRFNEALDSVQKAETILGSLSKSSHRLYRSYWAASLSNLGSRLSDLGRYEEALTSAQQAERIYYELADAQPNAYLPDWARSLSNLGIRLSDLGRYEEALASFEQAERIRRDLADAQPDEYLPDWAASLNNLGYCFRDLGRYDEALELAQQGERIDRELADAQPDAYLPYWAASLDNLGMLLRDLGRYDKALELAQQAERIRRELSGVQPDAYLPDWARALNNLGILFGDLGHYDEALRSTQQAERIRRESADAQPNVYLPNWALSLGNLAEALMRAGKSQDALSHAEHSVALYQALSMNHPKTYQVYLGWIHKVLAEVLLESGAVNRALSAAQRSEVILLELQRERPGYEVVQYGKSLDILSRCHRAAGDLPASLSTLMRALRELGPYYEQRPDALRDIMKKLVQELHRLSPDSLADWGHQSVRDLLDD